MNHHKVMIVEDDDDAREALDKILRLQGWRTLPVATKAQAIAALPEKPDFVLLDLILPDGDGGDVLKAIRAAGLKSRVIVMTADVHQPGTGKLWADGIESVLSKPLNLSRLFFLLDLKYLEEQ